MTERKQSSTEVIRFFGRLLARTFALQYGKTTLDEIADMSDEQLLSVRYFGKIKLKMLRDYKPQQKGIWDEVAFIFNQTSTDEEAIAQCAALYTIERKDEPKIDESTI